MIIYDSKFEKEIIKIAILGEGSYFGDEELLWEEREKRKSKAWVCSSQAEVYKIPLDIFIKIIK